MIIRNLRWGIDGGPMDTCLNVEIAAIHNEHMVFILLSMFEGCDNIYISKMPLFDISMNMGQDIDIDGAMQLISDNCIAEYNF